MGELVMLGPERHGAQVRGDDHAADSEGACSVGGLKRPQRAAKVYYRRRPCSDFAPDVQMLVIPPETFDAVCSELDAWVDRLPCSHMLAPLLAKDGLGSW